MNDRGRRIDSPNARTWAGALGRDYAALRDTVAAQRVMSDLLRRAGIDTGLVELIHSEGIAPDEPTTPTQTTPTEAQIQAENRRNFLESEDAVIESQIQAENRTNFLESEDAVIEEERGSGSRTRPIQPNWDTMSEQEAYDRIPDDVFYVDPDGAVKFKGQQ